MNMRLGAKGLQGKPVNAGRPGVIAALDVGSSKIACFIAKIEPGKLANGLAPMRVIGIGHQVSRGVRAGAIVDMDAAEEAIRVAVDAAERMAGTTVRDVLVTVSCGAPKSQSVGVQAPIPSREVLDEDLSRLVAYGQSKYMPEGRDVLHAIPINYSVDGNRGIRDPRGMFGEKAGVELHMVSVQHGPVRNLELCVQRCHLNVAGLVVAPYASGLAALVEDEMDLGVTLIDMGGGTTSLAVFFEGQMVYCDTVPVGGQHITNDIARGLSTPIADAERMKTLYGSALASPSDEREMIDVPQVGENDRNSANHIPRSILTGIIQPRLEETLELIRDRLAKSGFDRVAGQRVVLTGGAAQLSGAREHTARILNKQVRSGQPVRYMGLAEATEGPAFSAAAGLISYSQLAPHTISADPVMDGPENGGRLWRIGRWLKENF